MPAGSAPYRFIAYLPTLAHLYLNPKIHKDPVSFRPIVSQAQSFTKPLSRFLSDVLTPFLGTFSPAHLKDSVNLKALLLEKADPSLPFLSLDVESLFTNVPVEPLLDFLHRKHNEGKLPLPEGYNIDGFLDLMRLCVKATVFTFEGTYYRQRQGVSMGNPLAPVIACLYMEFYETELRHSLSGPQPSFWVRYIDDILLQWPYSYEEFKTFLMHLNMKEDLINLQCEWETTDPTHPGCATMPFLDLLIHRSPEGLSFSIYRKPTATDLYTHYYSAHSLPTKKGVIISLFLRALRLCDDTFLPSEIQHVHSAFLKLKYPEWIIKQALSTATARFHNPASRPQPRRARYHLALPEIGDVQSLRPFLGKVDLSTSYESRNTLRKQLSRTGPKAPKDVPCVYLVNCKGLPGGPPCTHGVYIGESGRSLSKRIYEHGKDIREANTSNALFVHMRDNPGHQFDLRNAEVVYKSTMKPKRQLVESSLIATRPNCNLKPGDFPVCRITAPVVVKCLKLESKTAALDTPATSSPASTSTPTPTLPTILPAVSSTPLSNAPLRVVPTLSSPPRSSSLVSSSPCLLTSQRSSPILQSQARSLPMSSIVFSDTSCPSPTPVAHKTRSRVRVQAPLPLSPYASPARTTGAIPKRSNRPRAPYSIPVRNISTPPQLQLTSPTPSLLFSPRVSRSQSRKSKSLSAPYNIPSSRSQANMF